MYVEKWRGRLQESTFRNNLAALKLFMQYLRKSDSHFKDFNEDQLIEYQKANPGSYEILDLAQDFAIKTGARDSYKRRNFSVIKSFFAHNRAPLPRDLEYSLKPTVQPVRGTLTIDELKRVLNGCNRQYRAIFLCMFQAGMGCGELLHWSDNGLEDLIRQLENNSRVIKVELPGRKKNKNKLPYHTYIGLDGREALKAWMIERPKDKGKSIFLTVRGRRMSYYNLGNYWFQHLVRAGLINPEPNGYGGTRYGKNLHELRDLFRTRWEKSGVSGTAAEYFMGHEVDPFEYNKAYKDEAFARGLYLQSESWLNILSEEPDKVSVSDMNLKLRELEEAKAGQNGRVTDLEAQLRATQEQQREILKLLAGLQKVEDKEAR